MATPERRAARYRKYQRADPDHRWQSDYEHLLTAPEATVPLPSRVSDDVLLRVHRDHHDSPDVSVVILAHHDRAHIDAVVDSVLGQELDAEVEVEVLAVVSGADGTAAHLQTRPDLRVIDLGPTVSPGAARNAARSVATGDFVVFVGSHVRLAPGSLAARLDAHRRGWALVTGPLVDGATSRAGRAAFFLDHVASPTTRARGRLSEPPPRCSYIRFALDRADWFPDVRAGEDTDVNTRLFRSGFTVGFEPNAVEIYAPDVDGVIALWRKHRQRGEALARIRAEHGANPVRLGLGYTTRRLRRTIARGLCHPDRWSFVRSLPLIAVGILAARRGLTHAPTVL